LELGIARYILLHAIVILPDGVVALGSLMLCIYRSSRICNL